MEKGMKFRMITIVILVLIVPFVGRASFIKKILFSNKSYAKQIEVKAYILTQEQIAELFRNPNKEPNLFTYKELDTLARDKKYCVFRVENLGELNAWGVLAFKMPSIQKYFCDYLVCISGISVASGENSPYPILTYEWDELYTK